MSDTFFIPMQIWLAASFLSTSTPERVACIVVALMALALGLRDGKRRLRGDGNE